MSRKSHPEMHVIESLADIPAFASEEEEAAYWGTHTLSRQLLENMHPLSEEEAPRPRKTRAISLRIDEGLLERLQALADQSHRPYQALLKQFVQERVELEESKAQAAAAAARQNERVHTILHGDLNDVEIPVVAHFPHLPAVAASVSFAGTLNESNLPRIMAIVRNCGVEPFHVIRQLAEKVEDLTEDVARLSEAKESDSMRKRVSHVKASEKDDS